MTATAINPNPLTKRQTETLRTKWDRLQGSEHDIDLQRAKLLHDVFLRLDRDEDLLKNFIVSVLGEYPGKRPLMFVRFVEAFDALPDENAWRQVGGRAMVILSRINGNRRRKVMNRVRKALEHTGRTTISRSTFRGIAREALGSERYQAALSEPRYGGGDSPREQLRVLKDFLLTLLSEVPQIRESMTLDVARTIGLDLVE